MQRRSSHTTKVFPRILAAALAGLFLLAPLPAIAATAGAQATEEGKRVVDINTATVEELTTVRGIGQTIAQRIVEFREKNGPFKSVEDLLKVQGIGERSLEKIRERLTAGKPRK